MDIRNFIMVSFRSKKIQTESSLGEKIEAKRKSQYITLEKAAQVLKISKDYLGYLEIGEYEKLPGEVYAKNFIRAYGAYLGFEPEELMQIYKRERTVHKNIDSSGKFIMKEPAKIISKLHMISLPKILKNSLIFSVVLVCLLYIGFKVEAIITPPELEILYPSVDILTKDKFVTIQGRTLNGTHVIINDQDVLIEEDGKFSQKINLRDGINEIIITAKKDHSKDNTVTRRVVVQ